MKFEYPFSGRSPLTQARYRRYSKQRSASQDCAFCGELSDGFSVRAETSEFYVIDNNFPYFSWDGARVVEHCLLMPKKHILSIDELSPQTKKTYVGLLASWENAGYSVYLRSKGNKSRSVPHQHTHLFKLK